MNNDQFEGILKRVGVSFYWYEVRKIWWVSQTHPDGKTSRSTPAGAETRVAAVAAAAKLIRRQFRDS